MKLKVVPIIYFSILHIASFYAICYTNGNWKTWFYALLLWPITGFGVTAGVHRFYTHRSYKCHPLWRYMLFILFSCTNQGGILYWVKDHHVHHKFCDTDADPYNAKRGFFFSHIGWLFTRRKRDFHEKATTIDLSYLNEYPEVALQNLLHPWWDYAWCFIIAPYISCYFWNESFLNAFLICGCLRFVIVLHATWCINSVNHYFGEQLYDQNSTARESIIGNIVSFGCGHHSYHHKFPSDYSNSEFGWLTQYNPTTFWIDVGSSLGLVWDRKKYRRSNFFSNDFKMSKV